MNVLMESIARGKENVAMEHSGHETTSSMEGRMEENSHCFAQGGKKKCDTNG